MELLILGGVSLAASMLTFLCGFGLGTILTPVFFLLFGTEYGGLEFAIGATAIVHFLNNIFKFGLMRKSIDKKIALKFGLTAIPFALIGALTLYFIGDRPLYSFSAFGLASEVSLLGLVFGIMIIFFSLLEILPRLGEKLAFNNLVVGGALSGFFGGLSGHQGALRSAFLLRYKLSKEVFIATGILIALLIDVTRIPIYFSHLSVETLSSSWLPIAVALGSAVLGAIGGKYLLKKIELKILNILVSIAMFTFGVLLATGFLM